MPDVTTPKPASATASFFDNWSGTWHDCYAAHPHFRDRLETLRAWLADKPADLLVLDYGCGTGIASLVLAGQGARAFGVDISAGMIANSQKTMEDAGAPADRFRFEHIGTDGKGAYLDETYDGIVSMGVMEYIPDYEDVLARILARLKPGGFFIMSGPNRPSPLRWLERFAFRHPGLFRHLPGFRRMTSSGNYMHHQKHQFRASELTALLKVHGLTRQRIYYHGGPHALGGLTHTAAFGMTMIVEYRKD